VALPRSTLFRMVIDRRVPRDTFFLIDPERIASPLLEFDRLRWAMQPDPLIHSLRWLQHERGISAVWVEDAMAVAP
jgi:hypothetical protein